MRREPKVCRLAAGGEWIRKFSSAMPRHRHQRGRLHSTAEADDCSDDTATPTVDRPQLGRSLETAAYLARNRQFESTPLQWRVCELSVPLALARVKCTTRLPRLMLIVSFW